MTLNITLLPGAVPMQRDGPFCSGNKKPEDRGKKLRAGTVLGQPGAASAI